MLRRRLSAVLIALATVTALSACLPFGGSTPDATSTPTDEQVEPGLEPYYSQALVWEDCGDGFQCATATAPMNWDAPDAAVDIELALIRQPATGTSRGALFTNPGGPGASGVDFVRDSVDFATSESLQSGYDVIGWDPRGVGRSAPVTCTDDAGLDDYIYGVVDGEPGSNEWIADVTVSSKTFADACLENTGEVLQYIDTVSTVRDLDMMRAVVGDEKLNYLGYSYGSDIGSYYAELFPERLGRMVLDGATDSSIPLFEVGLTQSRGFERALQNFLTACPGMFEQCAFTGNLDADLATVRSLFDRFDAEPVEAPDGRLMTASVIDTALSMALYSQQSWGILNDLFREVQTGSTETAFYLSDYYYSRDASGRYTDNSFVSFLAIYCVDYPVETDPVVLADQQRQLQEASPTTYLPTPPIADPTCSNWPYGYQGDGIGELTGAGADDMLVVSTTGDPATPYEWGVALADQLESAHLVTFTGEGHTAYPQGDECIVSTVDDYLLEGTVPAQDPNCGA